MIVDEVASLVDHRWKGELDQGNLRFRLTDLLAKRGDTGKLLLQIEELARVGITSGHPIFHCMLSY